MNSAIYNKVKVKKKPRKDGSELRGREIQIMIRLGSGSLRVGELMDLLGMGQTNVSKAISFLRNKKGFVSSKRDPANKKFILHSLTESGHAYLDNLR